MTKFRPALTLLAAAVLFLHCSFSEAGPPAGWHLAGSNPGAYDVGTVAADDRGLVAYLKSKDEDAEGFGTLMQTFSAESFRGKRLRMSGAAKANNVANWAGLWMRIDAANQKKMLGFDNMQDRPIAGSTEWQRYAVVLDIPDESNAIAFGVLLVGNGEIFLDDIRFEVVDEKTPVTGSSERFPAVPENLDFEER